VVLFSHGKKFVVQQSELLDERNYIGFSSMHTAGIYLLYIQNILRIM